MLVLSIVLAVAGILMLMNPALIWSITESWKSNDATGPSVFYIGSIRFGGVLCTLAGICGIVALLL
ncbi:DUF6199 family natural product biosynthesis protein [Paenibacillus sp. sgz302251]|uniref:DUF6199 family natural product biosynthesis protein n=1 Tax=Paenibacillus sp. sgz302251 TaxID=3414493 RepID=UPI003C7D3A1F